MVLRQCRESLSVEVTLNSDLKEEGPATVTPEYTTVQVLGGIR